MRVTCLTLPLSYLLIKPVFYENAIKTLPNFYGKFISFLEAFPVMSLNKTNIKTFNFPIMELSFRFRILSTHSAVMNSIETQTISEYHYPRPALKFPFFSINFFRHSSHECTLMGSFEQETRHALTRDHTMILIQVSSTRNTSKKDNSTALRQGITVNSVLYYRIF